MLLLTAPASALRARATGLLAVSLAGLLASACASGDSASTLDSLLGPSQQVAAAGSADRSAGGSAGPKNELDRAIEYWAEEHKKKPTDLKTTLAYARNLKAAGHKEQSFGVLQGAAIIHGDSKELASEMGRLALEFDQVGMAEKLLAMADDPLKPDWRLISARGTVMAKQNRYAEAIPLFERALLVSPSQPSVLNNLAMAHAASGDPVKAEEILRKASASSNDPKIKQNLALVLGLQGKHDEAQRVTAAVVPASEASADADYIKRMVKASPTEATAPVPAVIQQPQRAAAPAARVIEAKGGARPAPSTALRPASGPGAVGGATGAWSTSVQVAR